MKLVHLLESTLFLIPHHIVVFQVIVVSSHASLLKRLTIFLNRGYNPDAFRTLLQTGRFYLRDRDTDNLAHYQLRTAKFFVSDFQRRR